MKIAFRTDSSLTIGTGHVMRCLALAHELRARGCEISFICRDLPGNIISHIEKNDFKVHVLPSDAEFDAASDAQNTALKIKDERPDWVIVDHYFLDEKWESQIKTATKRLMVIDDLANRKHLCDLLLDQNYYSDFERRYMGLVPGTSKTLLGPNFAILREEFRKVRVDLRKRDGKLQRLMVFFGGSDPENETAKALEGLLELDPKFKIDVVVGKANPNSRSIEKLCSNLNNAAIHYDINNMAELMTQADLSIGGGGTTSWERCCLGLPSIVTILAENQLRLAEDLSHFGASLNLGWYLITTPASYTRAIKSLSTQDLQTMSEKGMKLVDGKGCFRVAEALCSR